MVIVDVRVVHVRVYDGSCDVHFIQHRLKQNWHHFANDTLKRFSNYEIVVYFIQIALDWFPSTSGPT